MQAVSTNDITVMEKNQCHMSMSGIVSTFFDKFKGGGGGVSPFRINLFVRRVALTYNELAGRDTLCVIIDMARGAEQDGGIDKHLDSMIRTCRSICVQFSYLSLGIRGST
jgi:hypothetical protein